MATDVMDVKGQAVAAAAAWWQGRPFPLSATGAPYPCTACGRAINQREGTSLIGPEMRCAECTTSYFGAAAPTAPVPPPRPAPVIEEAGVPASVAEAPHGYAAAPPMTAAAGPGPAPLPAVGAPPYSPPPMGPATPQYPPPSAGAPRRGRRWGRRTWLVVVAVVAVIGLAAGGLLLWAPWQPTAPAAGPTGVHVLTATPDTVTIGWSAPSGSPTPDRYDVVVSGSHGVIDSVTGTTTTYQWTGLDPATGYALQVVAYWGKDRSRYSAELIATTSNPSVADGRLSGSMPVDLAVTASTGGLDAGLSWTDSWTFTPSCATGPCPAVLDGSITPTGFETHPFQVTLNRDGAAYSGTAAAHVSHCGPTGAEVDVTDTVTINLTVRSAAMTGGEWLADSWDGTLTLDSPYTAVPGGFCAAYAVTTAISSTP